MASGKRTRKKRGITAVQKTEDRKTNHMAYHMRHGHCPTKKYGGNLVNTSPVEVDEGRKLYSFEDEYKTYRRTRGRRGLSPNPDKREEENPQIRLFKGLATHCGEFPIGELMEHPIGKVS